MVCAPGSDCMAESTSTAPRSHCGSMQGTEGEAALRAASSPELECCLAPATFVQPIPAVTSSDKATWVAPELAATNGLLVPRIVVLVARGGPPGASPDASPPPSGSEIRILHQSFLS